jgi:transposase
MRRNLFWLSDDQWGRIAPLLPTDVRGKDRADDRRVISGILHVPKSGRRWCDCPPEYGPATTIYNRFVRWAERGVWTVPRARRSWPIDRDADDRHHAHQGAPLGLGWKRGKQKQAIGRSRGGRNTKIHAIADAKGRLLSVLLSGGEAHDCPPAPRLIRRTKAARKLLGDKAYDSAPLRRWLKGRGTRAVVTNKSNRKQPFSFDRKAYKQRYRIENTLCRLKDFRRIATLIQEVVADIDPQAAEISLVVQWIGGVHSEIRLPRRRRGQRNSTSADIIAAVRHLALMANDDLIAGILNRNGLVTGHGNRWTRERVTALRSHHRIRVFKAADDGIEPWLNLSKAAHLLKIAAKTLRLAGEAGEISAVHPLSDGPWIFSRAALSSPAAHPSPDAPGTIPNTPRDRIPIRKTYSLQSHRQMGVLMHGCSLYAKPRIFAALRRGSGTSWCSDIRPGTYR